MKILLISALVALASADVSHLLNQQSSSGYQYQNPAPQNLPISSYGVPQASVLGVVSEPQLTLPSISGPSIAFNSGFSTPSPSGIDIQTYNGFSSPLPSAGLAGIQVSTPAPSIDISNYQVSTPAPSIDLSSFQVSSPAPSVDLSGFQVSTPSSIPSVNLVQYSQPSSSYQFLSKLGQPSASVPSIGFSSVNSAQFGSDASLNSGINFGSDSGLSLGDTISANSFIGKTSGGNLNDAFGIGTDASGAVGANQEPEVSKHLYFFAAPEEEEEEVQAKIDLPPVPPKKTYKIIFIKAPTYRNQAAITIPVPPQNEEKTLVYVLVKKPDGQPKVRFQDAAPTQPSKPEVFFIKYKTQKEAEAAVAEIQSKHGAAGHVIANLPAGAQAAIPSEGGVSVSSTPSSLSFGGTGIGSVSGFGADSSFSSGNLGSPSLDSLVAGSFISSTPSTANFESRISEEAVQGPHISVISQQPGNVPAQVGGGEGNLQYTFGQGGLTQPSIPEIVGQSSVDSLSQVLSGGVVTSESAALASGASETEVKPVPPVESGAQQEESSAGGSAANSQGGETAANEDASESSPGSSDNDLVSQNIIQQRIGGSPSSDNESEGSQPAGFASYGPPNY